MNNQIEIKTKIYASNCDDKERLRFDSILNYFQDIATVHATEMKTDFEALKWLSNAYWVLTKIKFKIDGRFDYNDDIVIRSWPLKPQLVRCLRDFTIDGFRGKIIGSSEWCMLDVDDLSIRKIESTCYPMDFDHLDVRSGVAPFSKLKEEIDETNYYGSHVCVYTDIDYNGHVNNVSYSKMALNSFTREELKNFNYNAFEINFVSQCFLGDEIKIYKKQLINGVYFEGRKQDKQVFKCLFYNEL